MISKTKMNRPGLSLSGSAGAVWTHGVLPSCLLALLGSGCGERFELGAVGQNLDRGEDGELSLPLIADGVEDADVPIEHALIGTGVGDVDGDGFDDWIRDNHLRYGRPRHPDGILATTETEGLSFVGYDTDQGRYGTSTTSERAGDVNGDGYDDLVFSSSTSFSYWLDPGDEAYEPGPAGLQAWAAQSWAEQRAFLWYGGPERARGEGALDDVAVAIPTRDDLPSLFQTEIADGLKGDETQFGAGQGVVFTALGDIDGDGYDDLALRVLFSWRASREEQCAPDAECTVQRRGRSEKVTYIFYGSDDLLTSDAAPAARLPGVSQLRSIGDVTGDGRGDILAVTGTETRLLAGSAERLAGELAIEEMGVPVVGATRDYPAQRIGDIDGDGYDDLFVLWEADGESARHYLFYGSPSLLAAPLEKSAASAVFSVHGPIAEFSPGDWDGDGDTDILLTHARVITDQFSPFAGAEARLIPGDTERYSGVHDVSVHRPGATIDEDDNIWGAFIPGDIDGDGFADAFLVAFGNTAPRAFVKYGSPLSTPIY